jgi:hypothetical protein
MPGTHRNEQSREMDIATYTDKLRQYHSATEALRQIRGAVRAADQQLGAYDVSYDAPIGQVGSGFVFRLSVDARFDGDQWPTAAAILEVLLWFEEAGREVVAAYNALAAEERRLVAKPQ